MARSVYKGLKAGILVVVLSLVSWAGVQWLTRSQPMTIEEAGVIVTADRVIPERIVLGGDQPVRLYIANVSGRKSVTVIIPTDEPQKVEAETGQSAAVELKGRALRMLDGRKLTVEGGPGEAVFEVRAPGAKEESVTPATDIAVVMCDACAAPKVIRLKRGVAVTLWVTKTASDVSSDRFQCDELGVVAEVTDGQVTKVQLKPESIGEFTFYGTVTPDSRVVIQVVD